MSDNVADEVVYRMDSGEPILLFSNLDGYRSFARGAHGRPAWTVEALAQNGCNVFFALSFYPGNGNTGTADHVWFYDGQTEYKEQWSGGGRLRPRSTS